MTTGTQRIHPTAIVDGDADIADDVEVGPFSMVGANVVVGAGSVIGSHCVVGTGDDPLHVGGGARIRSHSIIYSGSTIGDQLETGHHVTIREGMRIGANLRVGTACDLQGHASIGNCVRLHSGVQVNHNSTLEDFVWLFPYVLLTNDPHPPSDGSTVGPTIRRAAAVGARALLLPGIDIGAGSLVAAGSTVTKDVGAGRIVQGSPARDVGAVERVSWRDGADGSPYPWWSHFRRGYPEGVDWTESGPVWVGSSHVE